MAVRVRKELLTDAKKSEVAAVLTITEKLRYVPGLKVQPIPNSWVFVSADEEYYYIPYIMSCRFLKILPPNDYPSINISFTGQLRPRQLAPVEEALQQLSLYGTTTLSLPTGFGKTICAAALAVRCGLLTLTLIHLEILIKQQRTTFEKVTNGVVWVVGERPPPNFNIIICMKERLKHIPKEVLRQVGTLIIDEAHLHATAANIPNLLSIAPRYIILQTATLERDDEMHKLLYMMAGTHQVKRELTDVDEPETISSIIEPVPLTKVPFKVFKVLVPSVYEIKLTKKGTPDWSDVKKQTAEDVDRNNSVMRKVVEAIQAKRKPLILTERKEHAEFFYQSFRANNYDIARYYGSISSYDDADVLVGTVSKIGTAFDAATACCKYRGIPFDTLFILGSFASGQTIVQCVGRVLRSDDPIVLHYVNYKMKTYEKHWKFCLKWYESCNAPVTVIDY